VVARIVAIPFGAISSGRAVRKYAWSFPFLCLVISVFAIDEQTATYCKIASGLDLLARHTLSSVRESTCPIPAYINVLASSPSYPSNRTFSQPNIT